MKCKIYWGGVWAQESTTGGWLFAKVRPRWYWFLRRVKLFALIVWRRWDAQISRMDWRTAWSVSEVAVGLVGPIEANCGPIQYEE